VQGLFGKWTELVGTHSFSIIIDTRQFLEITIIRKHAFLIASVIPLGNPITTLLASERRVMGQLLPSQLLIVQSCSRVLYIGKMQSQGGEVWNDSAVGVNENTTCIDK
jgi:hypothetical protein